MARFPTGVVIVGGSAAGLSAADGLREGGYAGSITVLDDHLEPGFDRPMLSKGLIAAGSGARPVPLRTTERLAAAEVTILHGHAAVGLDIDRRLVVTSDGEAVPYEHVIVAAGVDARRLRTTSGTVLPALRNLRDLEIAQALIARHRSLTIVGGGFIGLEVAASLAPTGVAVTVLCPNRLPLVRVLGPGSSAWLRDLHRQRGVDLRLGSSVTTVREMAGQFELHLSDGSVHTAPAVLAGIGVEANTEWLIGSGVELDCGVVVDDAGRTNVPDVWAAGDVAAVRDLDNGGHRRFEHWTHAIEHGRHVGLNIARGEWTPFGAVPYVWTDQFEHVLHVFGERRPDDVDTVVHGSYDDGRFVVVHGHGDELHAVTTNGFPAASRAYKKLLRAGGSVRDALAVPAP